ncbi:LLM class F420-dependent oxidoreductase [Streptomyces sp. NPDC059070]|uniref:LLM class F420-dependent oxidoreductase n=1 Tax=unclassified Streptomyces TaxID=2593676 RepID=UPI0034E1DB65
MELRVFTEPQEGATYDTLLRLARAAEELGFAAFFRSDHYLRMGGGDGLPGPTDAWTTLAGLARETRRIRLGTLMSAATFRLPGVLAVQVAQVDQMSGGRVELGLGAGWYEREHTAYGIPFPRERVARLAEQLAIVTGLWNTPAGEVFHFEGAHYRLADSPALPKPLQRPLPVIVGGHGAVRTPRLAARYASEFNVPFASADVTAERFARVREAVAEYGRPADDLVYSAVQIACVGESAAHVSRRAAVIARGTPGELAAGGALVGTVDQVVDAIGRYAEAGAARLYLHLGDLTDLDHLELIGQRVLPQLR